MEMMVKMMMKTTMKMMMKIIMKIMMKMMMMTVKMMNMMMKTMMKMMMKMMMMMGMGMFFKCWQRKKGRKIIYMQARQVLVVQNNDVSYKLPHLLYLFLVSIYDKKT